MKNLIKDNGKYYKETDVVILTTKEFTETGLYYKQGVLTTIKPDFISINTKSLYVYFVSDENIQLLDWCILIDSYGNIITNPFRYYGEEDGHVIDKSQKKIIATTDLLKPSPLVTDYLPQPSPEFLYHFAELYNQNKPIDKFFIEYESDCCGKCIDGLDECMPIWKPKLKDNQIIVK